MGQKLTRFTRGTENLGATLPNLSTDDGHRFEVALDGVQEIERLRRRAPSLLVSEVTSAKV